MDDNAIIRLILDGNTEAYERLVQKYHQKLLTFIYRLVRDHHVTEDIGQDVFLSAYKSLPGFDTEMGTPFVAWLYIIARNRCVSYLRRHRGEKTVLIDEYQHLSDHVDNAEEALLHNEKTRMLSHSMEQLPEPFKAMIIKSLQGASLNEIASEFGIPLSTVKSRLFRARERIKQLMTFYVGGVSHEP
jgi:RNA polymerase sigma-70 factor (ECF subfamily)